MYRFSRSIYRELAPDILEDKPGQCGPCNHERVLRACEDAVHRLATDWHYFAQADEDAVQRHPGLLPDVGAGARLPGRRPLPDFAKEYFATMPLSGYDIEGNRIECRATTRRGTPCQRMPLPQNGYCPSHQHLAEPEEVPLAA